MCTLCFKKESDREKEEKWNEGVRKLEGCLKANKKMRKSRREEARGKEEHKQKLAARYKETMVMEENQQFLNAYKRVAESQL